MSEEIAKPRITAGLGFAGFGPAFQKKNLDDLRASDWAWFLFKVGSMISARGRANL